MSVTMLPLVLTLQKLPKILGMYLAKKYAIILDTPIWVSVQLAQLVERYIDIVEVTGSNPVPDTIIKSPIWGF